MKKLISGVVIVSVLVISACAQSKKASTKAATSEKKSKNAGITYVSMERTNCFGTCPHYIIEIYENGLVKYSGKTFADPKGDYETNIDKAIVTEIFNELQSHSADTCSEEYNTLIQDVPRLNYEIRYADKRTQKISNAAFGPEYLKKIAGQIDKKIKVDGSWKKTADFKENN